jgi:hypothetical protein
MLIMSALRVVGCTVPWTMICSAFMSVEPVSCFLGKVILGHRDRPPKRARDKRVLSRRDSTPAENARKTGAFGAASGKSLRDPNGWWSNEDSNQGPGRFYRRLRRDRCAIVAEAVREWRAVDTNTAYVERGNLRGDWPNHS